MENTPHLSCPNKGRGSRFWCIYCYENIKRKSNHKGHLFYRAPRVVKIDPRREFMKRSETTKAAPGVNPPPQDTKTWERFPNVYEHLGHVFWDDGKARTVSTLTVFFEDGLMKVALNDREAECSLFVTGKGFEDCLKSLEKRLNGEQTPDWRSWGKKRK